MEDKTARWIAVCIALVIVFCTIGCTVAYVIHPDQWCNAVQGTTDCLDGSKK